MASEEAALKAQAKKEKKALKYDKKKRKLAEDAEGMFPTPTIILSSFLHLKALAAELILGRLF